MRRCGQLKCNCIKKFRSHVQSLNVEAKVSVCTVHPSCPTSPASTRRTGLSGSSWPESFLPQVNGVTGSVCRTLDHLRLRGHSAAVVAPTGPDEYAGAPVITTGRVPLIGYSGFCLGVTPKWDLSRLMRLFQPDVVHLASPFVLGATAARTAHRLGIP